MRKMRKGIAIVDVLIALMIVTIIGVFIGKYIMGILDINRQMDLDAKFNQIASYVEDALQKTENVEAYTITPRGVLNPAPSTTNISGSTLNEFYNSNEENVLYANFEKALYGCTTEGGCAAVDENDPYGAGITNTNTNMFNDINKFTVYDFSSEERLNGQKNLFGIPETVIKKYGDVPFLFNIQRYGSYQGYLYPYKIFSLIDVGPYLYKRFRAFFANNSPSDIQRIMAFMFPVTDNGVIIRKIIHFNDIKNNDRTLYNLLVKLFGTNPEKTFAENKKYIKIKVFNTMPYVKALVQNSVQQMTTIKKNVEDWAVIQARIAAYDSLNGNSMDKDYFITCTGDGCNSDTDSIDQTRTLKPNLPSNAHICNSKEDSNCGESSTNVNELDLNNGFFICTNFVQNASHFKGYYCTNNQEPPSVINKSNCVDDISFYNNGETTVTIEGAARLDIPTNNSQCLLGEAARKLLSSTNFTNNPFRIPVYFSNGESITVNNDSDDLLNNSGGGGTSGTYTITLNVPLTNGTNNPPYTGEIFTIFPWFIGGYEMYGYPYCDTYSNSMDGSAANVSETAGFGIVAMPVFAHVF